MRKGMIWVLIAILTGAGCGQKTNYQQGKWKMSIKKEAFGKTDEGLAVDLYTMTNRNGIQAKLTNYGGIVVSLLVPDRNGILEDVVLGFDRLEDYLKGHPYFGAIVGRYGNRIAKGRFTIDGTPYTLAKNNGENHLHGGIRGFDKVVWNAEPLETEESIGVKLSYLSPDGEEGYPGNLSCQVTYLLTNNDELKIIYRAVTDKPTIINLTHHSYFNLTGAKESILGHEMQILADKFTPVDAGLIPTGELRSVENTPMDFRNPTAIGARIEDSDEQLGFGGGYDHNWVLQPHDGLELAAVVGEPSTGRILEVLTSEPGIQFYSGNFLDGTLTGKGSIVYAHRHGFCLETQHFPDSPNKPKFPSVVLRPGEEYRHETVYRFTVKN